MADVLIPIPQQDFDPTEVAVSWRILTESGHRIRFATPTGRPAACDEVMLTGEGLDLWGWVPGLRRVVLIGVLLRANAIGRQAYAEMACSPEFNDPISWDNIDLDIVAGLLLPGGHRARGMRAYLESSKLQSVVANAFRRGMPVAAICHGVLLAARSIDPSTGRSVLYGYKTTALTWSLERTAWYLARVTRFWDRDYYRTYPDQPGQPAGYMSVQSEVTRALARPADFRDVDSSKADSRRKMNGRARDSIEDDRPAFVVEDNNYLSARWPGDVHTFAKRYAQIVDSWPGAELDTDK